VVHLHGMSGLHEADRCALQRCVEDWVELRRSWFNGMSWLVVVPDFACAMADRRPVAPVLRSADIVDLLARRRA
jgi:hypothetical protein